ncbi:ABC transporter ATP-binding protein [Tunturiibacter gelidoferens]|uniref:ABC-2 type transport system ATP-binding protein n=1 Tax=Tunturiibacter gelidiferens TaxID=3069689 RepID=A0A9X0QB78_9BACT|nr:ABC transporter ATP-binding protein [Edaphobacter lichenicola]MBB5327149.1 ABC-2 type transport system ATP-binding protein [Edaphobacter lichenicola]
MPLTAIAYETASPSNNGPRIASKQPIATLTGVTKRYGTALAGSLALDGLNLALHPGEIVALLGPNGAGKSTAIKLLLGLIAPTSGTTRVFGSDPREAATRTRVGAMLQVSRITEMLKVREHLDLFRSYYPRPLPIPDILRIAQLQGIEDRLFGRLSGGQKQRVLFALALCGNPDLIFLDEPTVGMDIEARRGLWTEIRLLAAMGKTVLLTTHYLEEADALADRIIVINKGRVICEGTPAEIKRNSGGRRIRRITSLSVAVLQSLTSVTNVEQNGEATTVTATHAENVVREMLRRDETLSGLEIASPALEDAFLALTKN